MNQLLEAAKLRGERASGLARPGSADLAGLVRARKPIIFRFGDDGETPNNPRFPLIYYRSPVDLPKRFDPAAVFEAVFTENGWTGSWRDSIYPHLHFHTQTHEVLGVARGEVHAQFGGRRGRTLELKTGDVVVLPAGTGHLRVAKTRDLLVVGAYPEGGRYDEPTPSEIDHDDAVAAIARVGRPAKDPVYGPRGPLRSLWCDS